MKTTKKTKATDGGKPKKSASRKRSSATALVIANPGAAAEDRDAPYIEFTEEELARGCESRTVGEVEDERAKLLAEQEEELRAAKLTKADTEELLDWLRDEIKQAQSGKYAPGVFYADRNCGPYKDSTHYPAWRTFAAKVAWLTAERSPAARFTKWLCVGLAIEEYDKETARDVGPRYDQRVSLEEELRVDYLEDAQRGLRKLLGYYFKMRAAHVLKTNTKAADLWLAAADVAKSGSKWKGDAREAARLGRIDHEREELAGNSFYNNHDAQHIRQAFESVIWYTPAEVIYRKLSETEKAKVIGLDTPCYNDELSSCLDISYQEIMARKRARKWVARLPKNALAKASEELKKGQVAEDAAWAAEWKELEEEQAAAEVGRAVMKYGKLPGTVAPSAPVADQPEAWKPRKRGRPKSAKGAAGYVPSLERLAVFVSIMEEYRSDPGAKWAEAVAACERRDGKRYDWYAVDRNAQRWATYNKTNRTELRELSAAEWEKRKATLK